MSKLLIIAVVVEAIVLASCAKIPFTFDVKRFNGKFIEASNRELKATRQEIVKSPLSRYFKIKDDSVQYVYLKQYTHDGECDNLHSEFIFGTNICQSISTDNNEYSSTQYVYVTTDDNDSALYQYYYTDSDCQVVASQGTIYDFGSAEQDTCISNSEYSVSDSLSLPNEEGFYFQYSTTTDDCDNQNAFMTTWGATGSADDDFEDDHYEYNDMDCTTVSVTTPLNYDGAVEYNQTIALKMQSTSESSSSSGGGGCFAGTEMVMLESGESKPIADIVRGDRVLASDAAGNTKFSTVVAVPHAANNKDAAEFARVTTASGADILVTEDHLMLVQPHCDSSAKSELMTASAIDKGMCLMKATTAATVSKLEEVVSVIHGLKGHGLHTIITEEEFVVVNGLIASPFSTNHAVANAFYGVVRAVHAWMPGSMVKALFEVQQIWRGLDRFSGLMSKF